MEDHSNHLFSEDEIGHVLNRASVLQSNAGGRTYSGLTIKELEEIAREADIDPHFITAAANELLHLNEKDKSDIWGGPTKLVLRRRINGKVSEEAWKRMVSRMETRFGKPGETDEWDNTREWIVTGKKGVLANLVLHEHDGYTKMELLWDNKDLVTPFIFLALAPFIAFPLTMAIILQGIGASGIAALGLILLITLLFGCISRLGFGKKAAAWRSDLRSFADRLATFAEDTQMALPAEEIASTQIQSGAIMADLHFSESSEDDVTNSGSQNQRAKQR